MAAEVRYRDRKEAVSPSRAHSSTSPSPRMAVGEGRFSRSGMAVPSFPGVDVNPEGRAVQALEAGGAVV